MGRMFTNLHKKDVVPVDDMGGHQKREWGESNLPYEMMKGGLFGKTIVLDGISAFGDGTDGR